MSHDTSWDIEALRSPHEPQHQWELRRSFMEKHKSDFPMDRLVCLAQTLANMEFMGCRYPQDTMDQVWIRCKVLLTKYQVQELSRGLVEAVREKRAGKLKRTFVSGSEAASCKINRTSIKRPAEVEDATKRKVVNNKYGNFVAASTSKEAGELKNLEGFVLPPKRSQQELRPSQDFIGFCNGIINKANGKKEIAHETGIEKSALTRPEKERKTYRDRKGNIVTRESEVEPGQPKTNTIPHIGADRNNLFAQVKQGFFAENEKFSPDKVSSSQEGGEVFQPAEYKPEYKRHFEAQRQRANEQLESENSFYDEVNPMMASILSADPLRQFLLVTLAYVPGEHPCSLLNRSAAFSKMNVSWDYHGSNNCTVKINGQMISQAKGTDKKDARDKAAEKAIQILKGRCYTIEVKNQYLSDGTKVDLMDVEVNTSVGGKAEALGNSNVGHKLLSLMGWTGGGLGREGAGRAEPVTATTLFGREGLGNRCTGKHFKQKITKIVEEWMASSSPYDLVFTTGFDNDQRKDMHQVARRFNLKSKSYGKGDDRHLTISKYDPYLNLEHTFTTLAFQKTVWVESC